MVIPKRRFEDPKRKKTGLFDYYAAFSHSFVEHIFAKLHLPNSAVILDPWNGRGTTTTVGAEHGYRVVGFDLNPAMVAIASARLASPDVVREAIKHLKKRRPSDASKGDPTLPSLEYWFTPRAARSFAKVRRLLEVDGLDLNISLNEKTSHIAIELDRLQDYLYLGLATVLRQMLSPLHSSNPTWIKAELRKRNRLRPKFNQIWEETISVLSASAEKLSGSFESSDSNIQIAVGDSRSLPLPSETVSAVITSPPYCTRIDYAVATRPELAIISNPDLESFRALRESLIGTTTINSTKVGDPPKKWGSTCVTTLENIRKHQSKASGTYYYRNLLQYFYGIFSSLQEIDRVAKTNAKLTFVVQDSFYKDIHINLPRIFEEMGKSFNWELTGREDHRISNTLAASNPKVRIYRSEFSATETVLFFEKVARNS